VTTRALAALVVVAALVGVFVAVWLFSVVSGG
jgi:hypothetical protein